MEELVRMWIPFWVSRQGPVTGTIEHKNKLSFFLSSDKLLSKKVPALSQTGLLPLEFVMKPIRILLKIWLIQSFFNLSYTMFDFQFTSFLVALLLKILERVMVKCIVINYIHLFVVLLITRRIKGGKCNF
jgi:hypothetical protein